MMDIIFMCDMLLLDLDSSLFKDNFHMTNLYNSLNFERENINTITFLIKIIG